MPFSDYTAPTATVSGITLRGLNTDDLSGLLQRHGALIGLWFEQTDGDLSQTIMKAPALVADVIACAAGEPEAVDRAARMPFGVQIKALTEIWKLTFNEVDLGNVFRLLAAKVAPMMQPTANPNS